jgi:hypothetical protein
MQPSIPGHYNGYVDSSILLYYDGVIEPSIPDHYNGEVDSSIQAYYDGFLEPPTPYPTF